MDSSKSFTVDLADPSILSKKLPEAQEALRRAEQELEEKKTAVVHWRHLVAVLQALVNTPESGALAIGEALNLTELQARVVEVVNREMRKIRAPEVTAILNSEGIEITNDSVSNCLWYVAEKMDPSPIKRAGRGFYAPIDYKEGLSTADMAVAGIGMGALAALLSGGGK